MEEDVPSLAVAAVCHYKYNARCGMAAEEAVPPLAVAAICQKWHEVEEDVSPLAVLNSSLLNVAWGGGCTTTSTSSSSSSLPNVGWKWRRMYHH